MATMRELKGRISSVHSSQKMTGAMKMISSARKRQVENRLTQARPYQEKLWDIYVHMRQSECDYASPLAEERQVGRVAIVAFASDEGLCGAFNINISKKLAEAVAHYREQGVTDITVIPVGKKILSEIKRLEGIRLEPCPDAFAAKEDLNATRELADRLMEAFLGQRYDRVDVLYTYYKSMGTQIPTLRPFLPLLLEGHPESSWKSITVQRRLFPTARSRSIHHSFQSLCVIYRHCVLLWARVWKESPVSFLRA